MPPAEPDVAALVRDRLSPHLPLLLAVSGGPDSTALLVAAAETLPRSRIRAVVIDHGLRPESAHEVRQVRDLCARLDVPFDTARWAGEKPATGVMAAARDARRGLLCAMAERHRAKAIALAHTLDDQAETVLMRLGAGSGIAGLAAMAPVSDMGGVPLLRPLLDVPKAALIAFLDARGIDYVRDPTNTDPRTKRARLRELMPRLAREGIDAAALARLAQRARRADEALDAFADRLFADAPASGRPIAVDAWRAAPEEVRLRVLARIVAAHGSAARAPSEAELMRLAQALDAGRGGTLGGLAFRVRRDAIGFAPAPPRRGPERLRGG